MELKEALKKLNKERDIKCQDCDVNHYDIAIEALKKQIPMRAYAVYSDEFDCPSCGESTEAYDVTIIKFCAECGQKLKWK